VCAVHKRVKKSKSRLTNTTTCDAGVCASRLDQDRWIADGAASGTGFWRRRVQALSRPEGPERYFVPIIISARAERETPASVISARRGSSHSGEKGRKITLHHTHTRQSGFGESRKRQPGATTLLLPPE
jgi:hypothetical protein